MTVLGLGLGGNIIGSALPRPADWFGLPLLLAFGRCLGATLVPLSPPTAPGFDAELNDELADDLGVTGIFRSDSKSGKGIVSSGWAGMF